MRTTVLLLVAALASGAAGCGWSSNGSGAAGRTPARRIKDETKARNTGVAVSDHERKAGAAAVEAPPEPPTATSPPKERPPLSN